MIADFDQQVSKFNSIYTKNKGIIRLTVMYRDLEEHIPGLKTEPMNVLDIGCGGGAFVKGLAVNNSKLKFTLVDASANMIKRAKANLLKSVDNGTNRFTFFQGTHMNLAEILGDRKYDLILCHGVLEWQDDYRPFLSELSNYFGKDTYVSLLFSNLYSHPFWLASDGKFNESLMVVQEWDQYIGQGFDNKNFPVNPDRLKSYLVNELSLSMVADTGIRVFNDIIPKGYRKQNYLNELLKLELASSKNNICKVIARHRHFILHYSKG
mgnify:CR=1 FL=1